MLRILGHCGILWTILSQNINLMQLLSGDIFILVSCVFQSHVTASQSHFHPDTEQNALPQ